MPRCKVLDKELKVLREKLFSLDYVSDVYLFGSYATGKVHENSDLDLLVIGSKPKTIEILMELDKLCENPFVIVDVIYYDLENFKRCLGEGNLFLEGLSSYALNLKEVNL